jgi:hypothetical protein
MLRQFAVLLLLVLATCCESIHFGNRAAFGAVARVSHSELSVRRKEDIHITAAAEEAQIVAAAERMAKAKALARTLGPVLCASFTAAAVLYPLDLIRALQMSTAADPKPVMVLLKNFAKVSDNSPRR